MASRLRIFISAGPDLEIEREVVGKAIATLPVSLGWVIKYTPIRGELSDPASPAGTGNGARATTTSRSSRGWMSTGSPSSGTRWTTMRWT